MKKQPEAHQTGVWRAVYAPGDGQTSPAYSSQSVQCWYINHLLSVNKQVLSYLLLRLLPQAYDYMFIILRDVGYIKIVA
jgi:hypothetical protein